MSGKDSIKFYPVGETVIVEREDGLMECKVIDHFQEGLLYVEEIESKHRFLVKLSDIKKQKIFYEEAEG
ncbi:unnamed protein product [marine sediment metagenome]|uniref:Uncharacterized protein n=1 Tax=marine sediment metagenome TaxID=412755 RepID=X1T1Q0_9ZZZZ